MFNGSSANALNLDRSNILLFGKVKNGAFNIKEYDEI